MIEKSEKYYIICEEWALDSNQWSILLGGIGVFLTLFGFALAFRIYWMQRRDNSIESFEFFQSSLPQLKIAITDTIKNLEAFVEKLDTDNFQIPVLSISLNDNFLNKLNLLDLNRYYSKNRKGKLKNYRTFLIDSNFFGTYLSYFTEEINYLRDNYLKKEDVYTNWQLLRTNRYFSTISDEKEDINYKVFYSNWVGKLHSDETVFKFNEEGNPTEVKSRKKLVDNHIKTLAKDIFPFIKNSEKANDVNLIANKVISAYTDMETIKKSVKKVFEKDIEKFKKVLININEVIE